MKAMKELLFQIVPILKRIGMCAAMALAMAACSDDSGKKRLILTRIPTLHRNIPTNLW